MTHSPDPRRPARAGVRPSLRIAATVTALYPLLLVATLYGNYVLAWLVLGHPPRPSLDDPKDIPVVSVLRALFYAALMGLAPAWIFALTLNGWLWAERRPSLPTLLRLAAITVLWVGVFAFLRWDPFDAGEWIMD